MVIDSTYIRYINDVIKSKNQTGFIMCKKKIYWFIYKKKKKDFFMGKSQIAWEAIKK